MKNTHTSVIWRSLSSGILHRTVSQKPTNVSEVLTSSNISATNGSYSDYHVDCGLLRCDAVYLYVVTYVSEELIASIIRSHSSYTLLVGKSIRKRINSYPPPCSLLAISYVFWVTSASTSWNMTPRSVVQVPRLYSSVYLIILLTR